MVQVTNDCISSESDLFRAKTTIQCSIPDEFASNVAILRAENVFSDGQTSSKLSSDHIPVYLLPPSKCKTLSSALSCFLFVSMLVMFNEVLRKGPHLFESI